MNTIRTHIETRQRELTNHPFFEVLERLESLEEVGYFVPDLTFWVMSFQDVLRLNEERVTDPDLRKIARHHRLEDAGHDQWFLHDRNYIVGEDARHENINRLFGKETRATREAAYAIMAEVYGSHNEWLNIVLLLAVESTGHVFFEKVVSQIQKIGEDSNLKYFSSSHLQVELGHALFENEMERKLYASELPEDVRREAVKLVDRCYGAFGRMFDGLATACKARLGLAA